MEKKRVFKITAVKFIIVPKLDELSISKMKEMVKDDKELLEYFPDEFFKNKQPDRAFFFNVINTVYPGFLDQLISHASKLRFGVVEKEQSEQVILATDEWINRLSAVPFFSKVSFKICPNSYLHIEKWPNSSSAEAVLEAIIWHEEEKKVRYHG